MKCLECGAENSEDAKFCEECSKKLPETQKMLNAIVPFTFPFKFADFNGWDKKVLFGVIFVIVLVAVGVYALSLLNNVSSQKGTVFVNNTVSGTVDIVIGGTVYNYPIENHGIGYASGFIVSEDGYMVTAAHVIADPVTLEEDGKITRMTDDKLKFYLCRIAAREYLRRTQPDALKNISNEQLNQITRDAMASGKLRPKNFEQNVYIIGPAIPDSVNNPRIARIIDMGDPNSEVDIALLKIDNVKERLPTLKVSSAQVEVGDKVNIWGYPAEQFEFYKEISNKGSNKEILDKMYTATVTRGIVSAERPSPKGMLYYQTDAATDHGNSGGPVLNDKNQVIGILVIGFEKQGFNFFISSRYIIEICKKNGVDLGWNFSSV